MISRRLRRASLWWRLAPLGSRSSSWRRTCRTEGSLAAGGDGEGLPVEECSLDIYVANVVDCRVATTSQEVVDDRTGGGSTNPPWPSAAPHVSLSTTPALIYSSSVFLLPHPLSNPVFLLLFVCPYISQHRPRDDIGRRLTTTKSCVL